jgi:carbon storage regulator
MRVLSRKVGESVRIGDEINVTILHIRGDLIRFRINAPSALPVYREEVIQHLSEAAEHALSTAGNEHHWGGAPSADDWVDSN